MTDNNDLHEITWDDDKKEKKTVPQTSVPINSDPTGMTWSEAPDRMKYAVKSNGQIISKPFANLFLAEQHISTLADGMKETATVVQVDDSGKELLLE